MAEKKTKQTTVAKKPVKSTQPAAKTAAPKLAPKKTKPVASKRTKATATIAVSAPARVVVAVPAPALPDANLPWTRVDLHIHTPASHDYETPEHGYLGILKQAERRGLGMIAFADHNTSNGYRNLQRELSDLEYLERLGRIQPAELGRLSEFRRLLAKIVVLPGFEFTATFGFHILGIFPPEKAQRDIEHVLLSLKVPSHVIDAGLTEAGATSDVLTAYRLITEAGGLAIAAHANSTAGVSMRDMDFGGQTRIAFTQDPHLAAIEWTDLDKGSRSSARLLSGIRNEYPRRMFALQGSDAHRITFDPTNPKRLGVGERATEMQLTSVSFAGLKELLASQEFGRVRPAATIVDMQPDLSRSLRDAGESATQAFHPSFAKKGADRFDAILNSMVGLANAQGGTVWVGADANPKKVAPGVKPADEVIKGVTDGLLARVRPAITSEARVMQEGKIDVVQWIVRATSHAPHVLDDKFILRDGVQTRAATRDEIVMLARRSFEAERMAQRGSLAPAVSPPPQAAAQSRQQQPRRDERGGRTQEPRQQQPLRNAPPQRQQPAPQMQAQPRPEPAPIQPPPQRQHTAPPTGPRPPLLKAVVDIDGSSAHVMENTPHAAPASARGPAATAAVASPLVDPGNNPALPRSGVEVVHAEQRDGNLYFALRDSRNGQITRNVTFKSARDLWHYAVTMHNRNTYPTDKIVWQRDRAVLSVSERAGKQRFDVAIRGDDGVARIIYGVTLDSADDAWKELLTAAVALAG